VKKSPAITSHRPCSPAASKYDLAPGVTSGRSNSTPRIPGCACRIAASKEPCPPPTSISVPTPAKSYAATTAAFFSPPRLVIASSIAPASGCRAQYSKHVIPYRCSKADWPVCTLCGSSPHARQCHSRPSMIAKARSDPGASPHNGFASGVT
jgi:hypothetical protein